MFGSREDKVLGTSDIEDLVSKAVEIFKNLYLALRYTMRAFNTHNIPTIDFETMAIVGNVFMDQGNYLVGLWNK